MHVDMHVCYRGGMTDSQWDLFVPARYLPQVQEAIDAGGDWCEDARARMFVRDALLGILERNVKTAAQGITDGKLCGDALDPRLLAEIRQCVALAAKITGVMGGTRPPEAVDQSGGGRSVESGRREVLAALEAVAGTVSPGT